MIGAHLLFLLQAATAATSIPGTGAPTFTVPRAEQDPVIDGRLDEPVWSSAAHLTGFSQYQPADGRPADQPTDVRVFYTRTALYFGIVAHLKPGANVTATVSKRDNILNDDRVVIYLDTFDDRRRAFIFGVNPLGVQLDGVLSEGSGTAGRMFGGGEDWSPDFQYDSRGRLLDSAYVVEVRIPFKSLRFPSSGTQRWGINIARFTPSTNAEDTWVDTRRAAASFLAQSGTMVGITDVERGMVTDWQPFVTSALNGARNDSTGVFSRGSVKNEAGVNLRLGFPAVSLDATVNPDFSQVESDVGQVTVNERFSLFIPEKRPFFLEGIELFSTPNQLVYTRQIASPIAGGKLTGKIGRFGVAHITALDDRPGANALFNVTRLRTDLGGNSIAGITLTDRRAGSDANTVLAADSRIVFAKALLLRDAVRPVADGPRQRQLIPRRSTARRSIVPDSSGGSTTTSSASGRASRATPASSRASTTPRWASPTAWRSTAAIRRSSSRACGSSCGPTGSGTTTTSGAAARSRERTASAP